VSGDYCHGCVRMEERLDAAIARMGELKGERDSLTLSLESSNALVLRVTNERARLEIECRRLINERDVFKRLSEDAVNAVEDTAAKVTGDRAATMRFVASELEEAGLYYGGPGDDTTTCGWCAVDLAGGMAHTAGCAVSLVNKLADSTARLEPPHPGDGRG
jgi:hypothetical protein